ncbi:MAG TPA: HD domain-containing protein, partial [Anseongella sp.]|nr:HD domain-containing protein [Anseongella sp.]
MEMEETLDEIKDFAGRAHRAQKRKYAGEPYIVHPVRVMEICREYTDDIPLLAAALLHDVLEDTAVRKAEMREFL